MSIKRRVGLLRKNFSSEDTRIGYLPVQVYENDVKLLSLAYGAYDYGNILRNKETDAKGAPRLRAYKNLASARLKGPENTVVVAEVLISGAFDEFKDGFIFREYRLLQLIVTHCENCKRAAEFYLQDDSGYNGIAFFCSSHSNIARGLRPVADVVAFFNPDEPSFDVRRLDRINLIKSIAELNVPFSSALGTYRWIPTRLTHVAESEQSIAAKSEFEIIKRVKSEPRWGYDDGIVKAAISKERPAQEKPLLDPSEELFKLRHQRTVDRKRIDNMLKALRWKEKMIHKREEELRSMGVRLDDGEKNWSEEKELK
jgi:hypothetical protein